MDEQERRFGATTHGNPVGDALQFLHLGSKDYEAARWLLLHGFVLQGSVLASTALEKHFKAVAAVHDRLARGHLDDRTLAAVKRMAPSLYRKLNAGFVRLLARCYQLRYTDSLKDGFNIVLPGRSILADLDETVAAINSHFRFESEDGQARPTRYQALVEGRATAIVTENHILAGIDKGTFVAQGSDRRYEMRVMLGGSIMEVEYTAQESRYADTYEIEGLVVLGPRQVRLSTEPIEPVADGPDHSEV